MRMALPISNELLMDAGPHLAGSLRT